ncbi:MAG TPA: dihydroneopterin aldolase [Candidatus Omnitrophota bacterium]|nr:dihydroneopterin aldolase [Candidatus Omnitrophota bacterium]HPS36362.1 dihydroneopterin aldolase [Candidatus Omnitrophota bacterium]
MTDKISIQELKVSCIIGTLPHERKNKQKLLIDLEFAAPVRKAARRDDLRDALDYQKIAQRVTKFVSQSRFYLIETLAERLSQTLLREFKLKDLLLRLRKPSAIRNAKSVAVEIFRK